jgi:hypothetical protein
LAAFAGVANLALKRWRREGRPSARSAANSAMFAGIGINMVSHVLIRHLVQAGAQIDKEHRRASIDVTFQ